MKKIMYTLLFVVTTKVLASNAIILGKEKASTCVACHGQAGVSVNPQWPNLAGQHAPYLLKQLEDYKKGESRKNAVMAPIVAALSTKDMAELAEFYASLPVPESATPKAYLKRGEALYRGGDFKKHITACIACHGPRGLGNAEANFPVLSGQQPLYTLQQLQAFKSKQRRNDLNNIMQDISARMSEDDMKAVAYYTAGLH